MRIEFFVLFILSRQQYPSVFMIDHDLLILEGVLPPHDFENDETSSRTRNLLDCTHEEISVEIFSPAPSTFR